MVGVRGEVVGVLAPEGTVRLRGELWTARVAAGSFAAGGSLAEGRRVVVVDQDRLKLVVEAADGAPTDIAVAISNSAAPMIPALRPAPSFPFHHIPTPSLDWDGVSIGPAHHFHPGMS